MRTIRGAIFDLDGTILDSTWVWSKIDREFLGKRGFEVPDDYVDKITPMAFGEAAVYTIERFSLDQTPDEVMEEWNRMAMDAYANEVSVRPGTKELLTAMREAGIVTGVATSNTALLFEPCLKRNGVYELFHSITEIREVSRGKEFPDIYIKQAEKMGVRPEECVVFEDIIPALKGAKSGGFVTVGVDEPVWKYRAGEMEPHCDYRIRELSQALDLLDKWKTM